MDKLPYEMIYEIVKYLPRYEARSFLGLNPQTDKLIKSKDIHLEELLEYTELRRENKFLDSNIEFHLDTHIMKPDNPMIRCETTEFLALSMIKKCMQYQEITQTYNRIKNLFLKKEEYREKYDKQDYFKARIHKVISCELRRVYILGIRDSIVTCNYFITIIDSIGNKCLFEFKDPYGIPDTEPA